MTTSSSTTTTRPEPSRPRWLLLGDSHAGPIGQAAAAAGIPCAGGPLGSGRDFNVDFVELSARDVRFRAAGAERHYRDSLDQLGIVELAQLPVPLVSTFGFNVHTFAAIENWQHYRTHSGFIDGLLTSDLFDRIIGAMIDGAAAFYRHAGALGLRVLAVFGPQRVPATADPLVFRAAQDSVARRLAGLGVELVDLRARVSDAEGNQRPQFCRPADPIHGNLAFGRLIVTELLDRGL